MLAMHMRLAVVALGTVLLGGCSATGGKGNIRDHIGRDITNDALTDYASRPVFSGSTRSLPEGVAPMPFGQHPFGPWSVGPTPAPGTTLKTPAARAVLVGGIHQPGEFNKWHDDTPFEVRGAIHTVMHYIALRSGLDIIVEGSIEGPLRIDLRADPGTALPLQVIWRICKAHDLDMVVDDNFVILTNARWWRGSGITLDAVHGQRFSGEFVDTDASAAIMETCKAAGLQAYVPSLPDEWQGSMFETVRFAFNDCSADTILRKIAEQAGLNVEVKDGAYFFSRTEPTRKG